MEWAKKYLNICSSFLLSAVSPAVVVPVLLGLQERGYGESKGIATLVIAASSMDDVLAISIYGICLSMIFHTGSKFLRGCCS